MSADTLKFIDNRFAVRTFQVCIALALATAGLSVAGKWFGRSIVTAGHTTDTTAREIVIGNDVLSVPSNMIRFEKDRRDGIAARIDLYMRWPTLAGYTDADRDDFNNAQGSRNLIFVTIDERSMSRDMSGRFEPIYRDMIDLPGKEEPAGLTVHEFKPGSGYLNESLVVGPIDREERFVARCLTGAAGEQSLAPCERDVALTTALSVTYRFPREFLAQWRDLDWQVMARARGFLVQAP